MQLNHLKISMKPIHIISRHGGRLKTVSRFIFITLGVGMLLAACSRNTPEDRDLKPEQLAKQYSLYQDAAVETPDRWWEGFQSQELNGFIELGLKNNLNIHQARARIKQARATLEKVGGSAVPAIAGSLGTSRTQKSIGDDVNSFSIGLSASYELDMWGRVDSLIVAKRFDYQATRADLETAAMSIAANIAETWLNIITIRQEINILNAQVRNNETLLELLNLRFENAMANVLDVLQQQENLAGTKARIPMLEAREQILVHNLALLMGNPPGEKVPVNQQKLPVLPHFPAVGIPADLLSNRPDIRSAGLSLKSSDWDIASARANRLPAMTLSGSYAYTSSDFGSLFDNWVFTLGASLVSSLYDGGAKSSEVQRLEAVVEESLARYKNTVFSAIIEVENSISNEKKQAEYIDLLEQQLSAAKQTLREAERQYTNGLKSFIPVITEIPKVQTLEKQIISEKAGLLKFRIALFRALGGGWTDKWDQPAVDSADRKTGG